MAGYVACARSQIVMSVLAVASATSCVKNDCEYPGGYLGIAHDQSLFDRKEAENTPTARWYFCEQPMKKGDMVPDGKIGPITNLIDGSDYGYGGWVRVLSDDLDAMWAASIEAGIAPLQHGPAPEFMWEWTAIGIFAYDWAYDGDSFIDPTPPPNTRLSEHGIKTFTNWVKKTGTTPWNVRCYTVDRMRKQSEDAAECRTPAAHSPITGGDTSGSTTGGSTTGGDRGPQ